MRQQRRRHEDAHKHAGRGLGYRHGHQGLGPTGHCVCPRCEYRTRHEAGSPCQEERCQHCGAKLLREGSEHHVLWRKQHGRGATYEI